MGFDTARPSGRFSCMRFLVLVRRDAPGDATVVPGYRQHHKGPHSGVGVGWKETGGYRDAKTPGCSLS